MANGNGTGKVTVPGVVLGGLLLVFILVTLWLFTTDQYWFPLLASEHGAAVDQVFVVILIVTGIAFVATQGLLAIFVTRYGSNGEEKAAYWHDNTKAEAILIGATAIILTAMVFWGQVVWASIYFTDPPENALIVEATGQQFQWVIRYPGPDGEFGDLDISFLSATNNIGLDRAGAGEDDIVTIGQMHLIVNRPTRVIIRSTDVIHDFHVPQLRVKQDAVPGMTIESWFTPTVAGDYEIACAELCGLGHYQMKGALTVDATEAEFQQFLDDQAVFQ
jgi:cytochrome c oxidase subunit 2